MKGFIKKSGIYFDTKVKKGSNNAVTSDAVAKAIEEGGGGGGGSTDYADLANKPKINNVELSGNKSLESLGIASSGDLSALSSRVTQAESDIDTLETTVADKADNILVSALSSRVTQAESDIGDLSELTTTDKTSLVNAINEAVAGGGGGSSGGIKYQRFANKQTNGTTTISSVSFVTFTEASIKSWFDTAPTNIHAIIASKSGGSVVKVALKTGVSFIMEQASSAVTYDFVGVFYE